MSWFYWLLALWLLIVLLVKFVSQKLAIDCTLTPQQAQYAKRVKFLIIGAGFSGLCCGYFFKLMGLDFVIIEKDSGCHGLFHGSIYENGSSSHIRPKGPTSGRHVAV